MTTTVGLELEWADVDRWASIPEYLGSWNDQDYSIVNSDGHANCPTGQTWRWGGEINTRPTETCGDQAVIVEALVALLKPTINYKCNLHVHVGHDQLRDVRDGGGDLDLLKRVARYLRDAEDFVYQFVEPIEVPDSTEFPDPEELRGAKKRYRRNLTSHHHSLSEARWTEMMSAKSVIEFKNAHAAPATGGKRAWHVAPRPGMNMRSLWKHGTIEYRHFPGTCDPQEVFHAASWCKLITKAAVRGTPTPEQIWKENGPWVMPQFRRYDHQLALGFERTKFKK